MGPSRITPLLLLAASLLLPVTAVGRDWQKTERKGGLTGLFRGGPRFSWGAQLSYGVMIEAGLLGHFPKGGGFVGFAADISLPLSSQYAGGSLLLGACRDHPGSFRICGQFGFGAVAFKLPGPLWTAAPRGTATVDLLWVEPTRHLAIGGYIRVQTAFLIPLRLPHPGIEAGFSLSFGTLEEFRSKGDDPLDEWMER